MNPQPPTLPENPSMRRSSRYNQQRSLISWWGLLIGLILGIGGGLFWTWQVDPTQPRDISPALLRPDDKAHYVVAVTLAFSYDSNLGQAINRLTQLNLGDDPLQAVADIACQLAQEGYMQSSAGLRALRSMKTFYQLQGRSGCADTLIPDVEEPQIVQVNVPTPTPTIPPPPTKTPEPLPTATPVGVVIVPTNPPRQQYEGRVQSTFCDVSRSGLIEINVQSFNGEDIPGASLRVRWDNGESRFVTGLKPERGASFADFQMLEGRNYIVDMPGQSDPLGSSLAASACVTESGETALTSYRVIFVRVSG